MKILYVDMDNVLVDFKSALPHVSAATQQEFEGRLDEIPGIFALMDPMPAAIESFNELATCFDTYILSTSPWKNPSAWSDTRSVRPLVREWALGTQSGTTPARGHDMQLFCTWPSQLRAFEVSHR